jgi:hypothetical protein
MTWSLDLNHVIDRICQMGSRGKGEVHLILPSYDQESFSFILLLQSPITIPYDSTKLRRKTRLFLRKSNEIYHLPNAIKNSEDAYRTFNN